MPYTNTTFLPKTNGLVFADRLVARSDKGRVFGLGVSADPIAIADGMGANWVGTNVYEVGQTVTGKTAAFTGGVEPVTYRYRFQFKPTGAADFVAEPWITTTNSKNDATYTLTEPGEIKFQSQARDGSDPVVVMNSSSGIKTVVEAPVP